jgi:hypothetical protein
MSLLLSAVQLVGVFVGAAFATYLTLGIGGSLLYNPSRSSDRAENVRFVITTVAAERVRNALFETIAHTKESFPEYDLYCLIDENSDLRPEIESIDGIEVVVVPDAYDCEAIAKGRAMQYFTETVVAAEPDHWYAFIDDDNKILDDSFLYEIPYYEARGYRAMNPVLEPRRGDSVITYMTDHIRLVDDLTVYRLFTGVIGRPYLGFHGELLCVRGDVLSSVGFDRESIVEDFAFALELVREGTKVWQSQTRVSILSPHDVRSFLTQRARWYWGVNHYLPKAPRVTQCVVGLRMTTWSLAITSSWAFIPLWLSSYGLGIPTWVIVLTLVGSVIYILTIGIGAVRTGGVYGMSLIFLVPVYATLEHLVPFYALWTRQKDFTVIDK